MSFEAVKKHELLRRQATLIASKFKIRFPDQNILCGWTFFFSSVVCTNIDMSFEAFKKQELLREEAAAALKERETPVVYDKPEDDPFYKTAFCRFAQVVINSYLVGRFVPHGYYVTESVDVKRFPKKKLLKFNSLIWGWSKTPSFFYE